MREIEALPADTPRRVFMRRCKPQSALAVSAALHVAAWGLAQWLPQQPEVVLDEPMQLSEVTLLELDPPRPAAPAESTQPPPDPDPDPDPAVTAPPPSNSAPTRPRRPKDPTPPSSVVAADDTQGPTSEAGSHESPAGLSLRGIRHAPQPGVPRPTVLPPRPAPAPRPVGPRPSPIAGIVDRKPRSLADAGFEPHRDGTYRYRDKTTAFRAILHPNGRVEFKVKLTQAHRMGVTEAARSAVGEELFVNAKKTLLAQTFELRMNMAVAWAEKQMDAQLKALYRELLSTWHKPQWSAQRRRKALFTLWDDCEESLTLDVKGVEPKLTSRLDRARASAGNKGRAKILEFVGRHLPYGSKDAFTEDELRTLNASRHSRQRFDPYPTRSRASDPKR